MNGTQFYFCDGCLRRLVVWLFWFVVSVFVGCMVGFMVFFLIVNNAVMFWLGFYHSGHHTRRRSVGRVR